MKNSVPLISLCIPAYNRPEYLSDLLSTIVNQDFNDFEVVVSEDNSPKSMEIKKIVLDYADRFKNISFNYSSNATTKGYDGNFRHLINISNGKFCVFMGDDDLLTEGALKRIASVLKSKKNIGVVIRCWARADRESKKILEIFNYFDGDRFFEPGKETIATFYRRSVAIAGYTVNRELAKKFNTDLFDGTLLYQLYLSGMILAKSSGYYISDVISLMRKDSNLEPTHFFGNAKAEKNLFSPGKLEMDNSLNFVDGILKIAKYLEKKNKMPGLYKQLLHDYGCYSYPLLSVQSNLPKLKFWQYYRKLSSRGLWVSPYFHLYFFALIIIGRQWCEKIIIFIKRKLKRTPKLGKISTGIRISL
ncbi:glycosyltransferase family 2 protein [bacterium]|nr:glycosyltransferase family 2 protein [bacterium]